MEKGKGDDSHNSCIMMTSSNGNIFRVTGPLCGEFTGHRWIPVTKASDAGLWVNNREAGDLRRHRAHYDDIVMITLHHNAPIGLFNETW